MVLKIHLLWIRVHESFSHKMAENGLSGGFRL
jgi:hypothetical protein